MGRIVDYLSDLAELKTILTQYAPTQAHAQNIIDTLVKRSTDHPQMIIAECPQDPPTLERLIDTLLKQNIRALLLSPAVLSGQCKTFSWESSPDAESGLNSESLLLCNTITQSTAPTHVPTQAPQDIFTALRKALTWNSNIHTQMFPHCTTQAKASPINGPIKTLSDCTQLSSAEHNQHTSYIVIPATFTQPLSEVLHTGSVSHKQTARSTRIHWPKDADITIDKSHPFAYSNLFSKDTSNRHLSVDFFITHKLKHSPQISIHYQTASWLDPALFQTWRTLETLLNLAPIFDRIIQATNINDVHQTLLLEDL